MNNIRVFKVTYMEDTLGGCPVKHYVLKKDESKQVLYNQINKYIENYNKEVTHSQFYLTNFEIKEIDIKDIDDITDLSIDIFNLKKLLDNINIQEKPHIKNLSQLSPREIKQLLQKMGFDIVYISDIYYNYKNDSEKDDVFIEVYFKEQFKNFPTDKIETAMSDITLYPDGSLSSGSFSINNEDIKKYKTCLKEMGIEIK